MKASYKMSLSTLQIILLIGGFAILFCLSILAATNDFKFSKLLYMIGLIATLLYVIIVPNRIKASYNRNKVFTEDVVETYELLNEKMIST